MEQLKGMHADVYVARDPSRRGSAMGGLSDQVSRVTIVGIRDQRWPIPSTDWHIVKPLADEAQAYLPTPEAPPVVVVYRNMGSRELAHIEPLMPNGERLWFMDGGAYVDSCDSRVSALKGFYGAMGLHDRCEEKPGYMQAILDGMVEPAHV